MGAQTTVATQDATGTTRQLNATNAGAGLTPNTLVSDANGALAVTDGAGNLAVESGGVSSKLNMTTAVVIKAGPGRLRRIVIIAPGSTSGAFTFNDCLTTGAAAAANEIFTLAYNATANVAGYVINLDWPCLVGIVLSAVPGGGSPIVAVSYD